MQHFYNLVSLPLLILGLMAGCSSPEVHHRAPEAPTSAHSASRPNEAVQTHLDLDIRVDMAARVISGTATYAVQVQPGIERIAFDTRYLRIDSVKVDGVLSKNWWLGPDIEHLGRALEVEVNEKTKSVSIAYATTDQAEALQWLYPQQTADKKHPFLFTQSQAILARTWLPCQDAPGVRFTYKATVTVPNDLMAVMSASNPTKRDSSGVYQFDMPQPVPAYLMALAVGDLHFKALSDRTGVYAEASVLEPSAWEFADLPAMLEAAESLYGPYAWGRYDVLMLPPSFPFGGMENPRLTFATPTILAGDRSLTALIAHELAHSWSGNLVTNATWDDFWLNEGFTVYFERRIMEKLYGKDYCDMLAVLGRQDLNAALEDFTDLPEDTRLKLDLSGRNPDDGMSDIAYEKGCLFLQMLENHSGRESFDEFLKTYFSEHAFGTMDTEGFLTLVKEKLLKGSEEDYVRLRVDQWVYESGIPSNSPTAASSRFTRVETETDSFMHGRGMDTTGWTTHEWLHFLRSLPDSVDGNDMAKLDALYAFTKSGNSEIAAQWFVLSVRKSYQPAYGAMEAFLVRVGRRKFLMPIYEELMHRDEDRQWAMDVYEKARPNYHSVSIHSIDALLKGT